MFEYIIKGYLYSNIKIRKIKTKIWLYLNKEIYDEKYIQIAIQAYQGLAEISYKLNACWWMCSFTATRYDIDLTKKEFENYLIALMNRGLSNEVM